MAQFDGIGRIFRADLTPEVDRSPQANPTERDRKRREKEEKQDEEPQDSVELHEEEGVEDLPEPKSRRKLPAQDEDGLDISA